MLVVLHYLYIRISLYGVLIIASSFSLFRQSDFTGTSASTHIMEGFNL